MKITSVNNELIKETAKLLQKKYRDETGLFIIEGSKGSNEAIEAGLDIKQIFVLEPSAKYTGLNQTEVSEAVMSKITDAKTPPKVAAVAKQPGHALEELKSLKRIALFEGIKDPGNLGTILRTSAAFEIEGIILYGDTVDVYNPKCVRSAVGNLWKTKVFEIKDFAKLETNFKDFQRIATLPTAEAIPLNKFTPKDKILVMFGSEANGLSEELKEFATDKITIEMSDKVESLNLSISAGIILYKIYK